MENKYKLNLYTQNGLLKPEISRAVFSEMTRKHGEIIKSISTTYWQSEDDIINSYQNVVKRLKLYPVKTGDEIRNAIEDLVQTGLVLKNTLDI